MDKVCSLFTKKCGGVAIIPVHQYYNPGHKNHGKVCVVLGFEVAGPNAGKWNFIGGSASDHGQNAWNTLVAEAEEELGLPLEAKLLSECMIRTVTYSRTEFIGLHITGLSSRKWDLMNQKRRSMRLGHRFLEMSAISSIPIDELATHPNVSDYVRTYVNIVRGFVMQNPALPSMYNKRGVHYLEFVKATKPVNSSVPMLQ